MRTWREHISSTITRVIDIDLPDFSKMTLDEIADWDPPEPDPYLLLSYPLQTDAWRRAFLHDYYWVGETALFVAVSHVWSTLAPPRAQRCSTMGAISGTGGTGKVGLVLTLMRFLEEMLAVDHPFPPRSAYPTLEAWKADAQRVFAADEADRQLLIENYSAILDGEYPIAAPPSRHEVIMGPWAASGLPGALEGGGRD